MASDQNEHHSLEQIELEMLQRAREVWNIEKDLPFSAFDPLVKMLISACAVEVKKIANEIHSSRRRVIEQLAQMMMPDVLRGAEPASTIVQIESRESRMTVSPELQLSCMRDDNEVVFSPAGHFEIVDAKIEQSLLLLSDNLINIKDRTQPQLIDIQASEKLDISNNRILFLGVDIPDSLESMEKLTFYFDWTKTPKTTTEEYCKLLQTTQWHISEIELSFASGIPYSGQKVSSDNLSFLREEHDVPSFLEQKVNEYFKYHYVTVSMPPQFLKKRQVIPDAIAHIANSKELQSTKPLIWFEIQFPIAFPNIALKEQLTHCLLNCIPVLNRKLETKNFLSYDSNMNAISLQSNGMFLYVQEVSDSTGNVYQNIQSLHDNDAQYTYYIRKGGVNRIDTRKAKEYISYLLDILKDDVAAFKAFYPDDLVNDLRSTSQIVAKIDENMKKLQSYLESPWHLIINQSQSASTGSNSIHVKYWTSLGNLGNDIPPGEISKVSFADYGPDIKTVSNIIPTRGGRDRLSDNELVNYYRYELLTRGRIVTPADLKSFCFAYLGTQIDQVHISKGFKSDYLPKAGMIRTVDVKLFPSATNKQSKIDWDQVIFDLQKSIESNWFNSLPVRIFVDE